MTGLRSSLTAAEARAWRRRWDLQQERLVPRREGRFRVITEALGLVRGRRLRELDLGCGTGSLAERILARFPRAEVVALDYDPIVLAIGRTALGNVGGRLEWVEADLRRSNWEAALPSGRFDAVVSSTALHWLRAPELGRVLEVVRRRLRPNGLFLNADWIAFGPGAPTLTQWGRRLRPKVRAAPRGRGESWSEWWRAVLRDPHLRDEARLHRERFPRAHGRITPPDLPGFLGRLRRVGFREVELIWTVWQDRVVAAVR